MAAAALKPDVAIVGGGVTGTVAARQLARLCPGARVTLFDQGRGLGGRASHRRVLRGKPVAPDCADAEVLAFDHGCQFIRADDDEFREHVLQDWLRAGVVAEWRGRFSAGAVDFFGVGGRDASPVYSGVGGMHAVCSLDDLARDRGESLILRRGVRVGSVSRAEDGRWSLAGVGGEAAIHDSAVASAAVEAARAADGLGAFDVVLVTDASAAQEGWHRASAGLPESFLRNAAKRVADRVRIVLFTAMVAFERPVALDLDALTADGGSALWFAARTNSKPGLAAVASDCWTLVSTPAYAAAEIERVPMRDASGAFVPQSAEVLRGPAEALLKAFEARVGALPEHTYLHAQRWGSAFPSPAGGEAREIAGTRYDASDVSAFADNFGGATTDVADDFCDGGDGLFYAGDFCSPRPPGVEAAALSALHASTRIAERLSRGD
mmetsp:Transcript_8628/g.25960  ORF Transcript_8628/g.25960 Transcript_8628/m.25960 type:complete len:437 (+) Transcript_8628:235-1545(+)